MGTFYRLDILPDEKEWLANVSVAIYIPELTR